MMSVKVGLHWLAFTTRLPLATVLTLVCKHCHMYEGVNGDQTFYQPGFGGKGYLRQHVGWKGIKVYSSDGRDDVHVEIPGDACEFAGTDRLLRLWSEFCELGPAVLRRVDCAMDGLVGPDGEALDPAFVHEMAFNSPERVRTWANLHGAESVSFAQNRKGKTAYIGSPSSERRVRVYDMRGYTRMELQVRGDRAESYGEILEGRDASDLPRLVVGFVRSFVDFVEPASSKSRAELQAWWAVVVGDLEKVEVEIARPAPTIDAKFQWLQRAVRRTLAVMHLACYGDQDWFAHLLEEGQRQLSKTDLVMVEQARIADWRPPLPDGSSCERGLFDVTPLTETRRFLARELGHVGM